MRSDISVSDVVRICIPADMDSSAQPNLVLEGWVAAATSDALSITVRDPVCRNSGAIPTSVP
jgi:hypothetical protein